ncbi:MAG: LysM peptidoglycan-binding domain-containing protein [Chloroflexota bacterium]
MLIVGMVLILACGWVGGSAPTPTPAPTPAAKPSPSPSPAGTSLLPGQPGAAPSPSPSPSPSPEVGGETYTVAEGDTLATIAERFYGDPTLWRRIYDANRSLIGDNPDSVKIGTTLRIPPKP